MFWSSGDKIAVFYKNTLRKRFDVTPESIDSKDATFEYDSQYIITGNNSDISHNISYYPFCNVTCAPDGSSYTLDNLTLPETQAYVSGSVGLGAFPMVAVSSNSTNGTIEYATAYPTTFIKSNESNSDWYYTGSSTTDNTRWTTSTTTKSIYDPCPSGWRVPDGGNNGIWSKALGSSSSFTQSSLYDSTNEGMNFSGKFGSDQTIWYPASGFRYYGDGSLYYVGDRGFYWSASPFSNFAYYLLFGSNGFVNPSFDYSRALGLSVRCLQE